MATQIKITQLTDIGSANLAVTTLLPVVNMAGIPTTQKTTLGNLANVILSQSGGNYVTANRANIAYSVANAAQPNITSVGTLTTLAVSGNATINGNITSTGTAYLGNISTTGLASITTLNVGTTANLGSVGNVKITGGTANYVLSTDGAGNLSWTAQTEASFSIESANFNANVGGRYGVNTTSGAITATLPASPSTGGAIFFADAGGAFASNNLTINPNGQTIMGSSGSMTVSTNNQNFGLFFNGTTWRTYN